MPIVQNCRVGVTGATGFVGRHLVKLLLERGVAVRALVRRSTNDPFRFGPRPEVCWGDVCDRESVQRFVEDVDLVFHTAALVTPWVRKPAEQHAINTQGTRCIVEAAESSGKRLVCTSSIVVFNPYPPPRLVRLLDGNHYVQSKRAALQLVHEARKRGARISTVIPGGILGPEDSQPTAIGDLIRSVVRHERPTLSFRGGMYFVDVRTVAEAHLEAAFSDPDDYSIPGEYCELDRFYARINEICGRRARIWSIPAPLVFAGSAVLSARAQLWTHRAPEITPAWVYYFRQAAQIQYPDDSSRLSIQAMHLDRSLADTVAWFQRTGQPSAFQDANSCVET